MFLEDLFSPTLYNPLFSNLLIFLPSLPTFLFPDCRPSPPAVSFTDVTSTAGVGDTGDGRGMAWADYDGDGDLDLYITIAGGGNALYQNDGDGTFTDVTSAASVGDTGTGVGTAWADYDGDGDLDLYVTNYGEANVLYRNDGDGIFTGVTSTASVGDTGSGVGTAWADYDGDGDLDLYVANYGQANVLYQNDGDGTFTDVTSTASVGDAGIGRGTAWADYDGDGDLDLYVTNFGQANVLYQNNGDGTFTDVTSIASVGDAGNGVGTAFADYDGDGDLDLYVVNVNAANVLYQNDGGVASITLVVKPLTGAGAPSIFGAVTLSTADGNVVALRTLDGGSGYSSQNRSVLSGKGGKDRGACVQHKSAFILGATQHSCLLLIGCLLCAIATHLAGRRGRDGEGGTVY